MQVAEVYNTHENGSTTCREIGMKMLFWVMLESKARRSEGNMFIALLAGPAC